MFKSLCDTIAAIATPQGEGGVGIVKISGPEAELLVGKIFLSSNGISPKMMRTHQMYHGVLCHPKSGGTIDEVLCVLMKAPRSFTGESMAEIHGHGGAIVLQMILEAVLSAGARMASPGEFTRRAFLRGKVDLVQAEAIADMIHAKTGLGVKAAQEQMEGRLSRHIRVIRQELLDLLAGIEASLDFPEEEIKAFSNAQIVSLLNKAADNMKNLLKGAEQGKVLRDGARTVIVGKPNVGKSSLWNTIIREDRAIVTSMPGTTRDSMQEYVNCHGALLHLIDTAGLCVTDNVVENIGISFTQKWLEKADMLLVVLDRSQPLQDQDKDLLKKLETRQGIAVLNKCDLPQGLLETDKKALNNVTVIETSLLNKSGIEQLEAAMYKKISNGGTFPDGEVVTNVRHKAALERALLAVNSATNTAGEGYPCELVTGDLRTAIESLGLIIGENITEEVLDTIFSRFCIGK